MRSGLRFFQLTLKCFFLSFFDFLLFRSVAMHRKKLQNKQKLAIFYFNQ